MFEVIWILFLSCWKFINFVQAWLWPIFTWSCTIFRLPVSISIAPYQSILAFYCTEIFSNQPFQLFSLNPILNWGQVQRGGGVSKIAPCQFFWNNPNFRKVRKFILFDFSYLSVLHIFTEFGGHDNRKS